MTNTKAKGEREQRVQIKTRPTGPVQPSGFTQLRRHADLNSVDTVAEILSLPVEGPPRPDDAAHSQSAPPADPNRTQTGAVPVPDPDQTRTSTGAVPVPEGHQPQAVPEFSPAGAGAPAMKAGPKSARPKAMSSAAPDRDFGRVANSITRDALPAGAFPGSSKKIYDVLYLRTRAAVTPAISVRATRRELMRWTGIKDIKTVNAHIKKLIEAGLIIRTKLAGEHEGSIYEVVLPEEVNQYRTRTSTGPVPDPHQSRTGAVPEPHQKTDPDQYQNSVRVGSGNPVDSTGTSGELKTSFKTTDEKLDDEAFAGLIALLKQATSEVTGKDASPAEAERWTEVGELLVAELKQAATRTTVSSVPAFLAEHLRRRLSRQPTPQPAKAASPVSPPPKPPEPAADDELIEMFAGMLHQGLTVEDLDGQLSASVEPERWPRIRAAALERYERERGHVGRPTDAGA